MNLGECFPIAKKPITVKDDVRVRFQSIFRIIGNDYLYLDYHKPSGQDFRELYIERDATWE